MKSKEDEIMDKILKGLVVAGASLIWGLIMTQGKDPEKKLRDQTAPSEWEADIGAIICPHCEAHNEAHERICFNCGQQLLLPQRSPANTTNDPDALVAFLQKNWVWVVIAIVIFILYISSASG